MWPGFESGRRRHIWIEFGVGSLPCSERVFPRYSGLPFSLKTVMSKFHFDLEIASNRPFYRYGGHIELIRFKEYYRMPRGHERISFVFSSAFRDIFS